VAGFKMVNEIKSVNNKGKEFLIKVFAEFLGQPRKFLSETFFQRI
jgi:hypothetical protein